MKFAHVTHLSVAEAKGFQGCIAYNKLYEVQCVWFTEVRLQELKTPIAPLTLIIGPMLTGTSLITKT
jgi:hypothetical protein